MNNPDLRSRLIYVDRVKTKLELMKLPGNLGSTATLSYFKSNLMLPFIEVFHSFLVLHYNFIVMFSISFVFLFVFIFGNYFETVFSLKCVSFAAC